MLFHLGESFTGSSATDHDGNEINKPFPELLLGLAPGGGRAVLEGGTPPITRLQIFVFAEDDIGKISEIQLRGLL